LQDDHQKRNCRLHEKAMRTIVECVPNFSEGRDSAVVDQIVAAIKSVSGLQIMDVEMDRDHNRSVITFVGEIDKVGEGALRAIGRASELIDLTRHSGAHPRIGATDVVPFVPIRNITLEECVAVSRMVGEEIYRRFHIPVYLYEAAARRPDRVQLENLRKGQFEGLRDEVQRNPDRHPDFGLPELHPTAGATVVGARKFLIAYNVNLNSTNLEIARQIARTVRFSSGGLRYVKAMGVELKARNLIQVSMNLTDFEQTPVHRVFEMVLREAERHGVTVAESEIVGLIPLKAIEMAAEFFLRVENFKPESIFENRLSELLEAPSGLGSMPITDFLAAVAKAEGFPGGGSVAALAGSLAAALGKMVLGFTIGKKKYEAHGIQLQQYLQQLDALMLELQHAVDRDSQAFAAFVAAQQLPKDTAEERQNRDARMQEALVTATEIPMKVAEGAVAAMQTLQALRSLSNPNLASDLNTGVWLAISAAQGALENVSINLKSLQNKLLVEKCQERRQELKDILKQACLENC
jgi:glutamate formiminotransferase / formiminotetrahydrofolate cyclodeaminase